MSLRIPQAIRLTAPTSIIISPPASRRPSQPALDVLLIGMESQTPAAGYLRETLTWSGLRHAILWTDTLPGASVEARREALLSRLRLMKDDGRLGATTQVIIHQHGCARDGTVYAGGGDNSFDIDLRVLVEQLNNGSKPIGLIHIATCQSLHLAPWLARQPRGQFLLYSGRRVLDEADALTTIEAAIGKVADIRNRKAPDIAEAVWKQASTVSGEKLTLIQDGRIQTHQLLKSPATDTPPSTEQRIRFVMAKLTHGSFDAVVCALQVLDTALLSQLETHSPMELLVNIDGQALPWEQATRDKMLLLLALGMDPNQFNSLGATALHYACAYNNAAAARYLLANSALPHIETPQGNSAFTLALLQNARASAAVLERYQTGETFPEHHVTRFFFECVDRGRDQAVDLILRQPAARILTDEDGNTLVHLAVGHGREDLLRRMLQHGLPVSRVNQQGDSALHGAVVFFSLGMTRLLLEAGADPNLLARDGESALHRAARLGHKEHLIALLHYGADASLRNREGHSAADLAAAQGFTTAAAMLRDAEAGFWFSVRASHG